MVQEVKTLLQRRRNVALWRVHHGSPVMDWRSARGVANKYHMHQPRDARFRGPKGSGCHSLFPLSLFLLLCTLFPRETSGAGYVLLTESDGRSGECLTPGGSPATEITTEDERHCCGNSFSLSPVGNNWCCGLDVSLVCTAMCDADPSCTGLEFEEKPIHMIHGGPHFHCKLFSGQIGSSDGTSQPEEIQCLLKTRCVCPRGHVIWLMM